MGERSNFALLPAFEEAVRTVLGWGVANIEETLGARNAALADRLAEIGMSCLPEGTRGGHYLCPALPESVPADLTTRLKEDGVFVSRRGDRLRITQHLFTTDADAARFMERLAHHLVT
jgi:selenocysteine lyase/cysteine desulfurase